MTIHKLPSIREYLDAALDGTGEHGTDREKGISRPESRVLQQALEGLDDPEQIREANQQLDQRIDAKVEELASGDKAFQTVVAHEGKRSFDLISGLSKPGAILGKDATLARLCDARGIERPLQRFQPVQVGARELSSATVRGQLEAYANFILKEGNEGIDSERLVIEVADSWEQEAITDASDIDALGQAVRVTVQWAQELYAELGERENPLFDKIELRPGGSFGMSMELHNGVLVIGVDRELIGRQDFDAPSDKNELRRIWASGEPYFGRDLDGVAAKLFGDEKQVMAAKLMWSMLNPVDPAHEKMFRPLLDAAKLAGARLREALEERLGQAEGDELRSQIEKLFASHAPLHAQAGLRRALAGVDDASLTRFLEHCSSAAADAGFRREAATAIAAQQLRSTDIEVKKHGAWIDFGNIHVIPVLARFGIAPSEAISRYIPPSNAPRTKIRVEIGDEERVSLWRWTHDDVVIPQVDIHLPNGTFEGAVFDRAFERLGVPVDISSV